MREFTYDELARLRDARAARWRMGQCCALMHPHTRDEVLEAIDALVRCDGLLAALVRVNEVLTLQRAGVPLINGRQHWTVAPYRPERTKGWG